MTDAEIIQIVLGVLSLGVTIVVSFTIYWLQRRHEKQIERIEEIRRQEKLTEEAHRFVIENAEEVDYLPWCVIATNLHRHSQHKRKIYTNFNSCSVELQNKILEVAGFELRTIEGTAWVNEGFEKLKADIKKYHLGEQPFLYDGAKYFHRSFEWYKDMEYKGKSDRLFNTIYKQRPLFIQDQSEKGKVSLSCYVEQYFDYILDVDKKLKGLEWEDPTPPVDYVWLGMGINNMPEDLVCLWVMELVGAFIINIHNREDENDGDNLLCKNSTDAIAETYEDRYYEVLGWLYFTYCYQSIEKENLKLSKMKQ